jgi:hypothetical protein
MQTTRAAQAAASLASDLRFAGAPGAAALPADFVTLCDAVEQIEGVRFRELVEKLAADRVSGDELLQRFLASVPRLG